MLGLVCSGLPVVANQPNSLTAPNPISLQGQADKEAVVAHCLAQFSQKFDFFVKNIEVRLGGWGGGWGARRGGG